MNDFMIEPAVELRHCKIRRRLAKDLVGLAQFTDLPLQSLDALAFLAGRSAPKALVPLSLPDPVPQRLGPCSRSSPQSSRLPPIATRARPGVPKPSAPRGRGPPV